MAKRLKLFVVNLAILSLLIQIGSVDGVAKFLSACKNRGGTAKGDRSGATCKVVFPLTMLEMKPEYLASICDQLFPLGTSTLNPKYDNSTIECHYTFSKCGGKFYPAGGECYVERDMSGRRTYDGMEEQCKKVNSVPISRKEFDDKRLGIFFSSEFSNLRSRRARIICKRVKTEDEKRREETARLIDETNAFHNTVHMMVLPDGTYRRLYVPHEFDYFNITPIYKYCPHAGRYFGMRGTVYSRLDPQFEHFPIKLKKIGRVLANYWTPGHGKTVYTRHYRTKEKVNSDNVHTPHLVINLLAPKEHRFKSTTMRSYPIVCELFDKDQDATAKCPEGTKEWVRGAINDGDYPKRCIKLVPVDPKLNYYRDNCFEHGMTIIAPVNVDETASMMELAGRPDAIVAVDGLLDVKCYDSEDKNSCQFQTNDESTDEKNFRKYLSGNWGPNEPNLTPYSPPKSDAEYKRDCLIMKDKKFYTESCYPDIERRAVTHVLCSREPDFNATLNSDNYITK